MSTDITFAKALKARRSELGHTIREAGMASGTSHATISRWEAGRMVPTSPEQLLAICNYLGISREELSTILAESFRRNILADIARFEG